MLLLSNVPLPRGAGIIHVPYLLTLGHQMIYPPFDGPSFYQREDIEHEVIRSHENDYLFEILARSYPNTIGKTCNEDYLYKNFRKENRSYVIPNIFTVRTRKFAVLVHFNTDGLHLPCKQPAFVVFQESLGVLETHTYHFMLYPHQTLPRKPAYEGFNYVCTHNKHSLFVEGPITKVG